MKVSGLRIALLIASFIGGAGAITRKHFEASSTVQSPSRRRHDSFKVIESVPRGGGADAVLEAAESPNVVLEALNGLQTYMKGPKTDTLTLLLTTAFPGPSGIPSHLHPQLPSYLLSQDPRGCAPSS